MFYTSSGTLCHLPFARDGIDALRASIYPLKGKALRVDLRLPLEGKALRVDLWLPLEGKLSA